jgi:hypothetical protein
MIITYFYKDGTGYRVDARYQSQRSGFSELVDNKDDAIRLTQRIQKSPEKFML